MNDSLWSALVAEPTPPSVYGRTSITEAPRDDRERARFEAWCGATMMWYGPFVGAGIVAALVLWWPLDLLIYADPQQRAVMGEARLAPGGALAGIVTAVYDGSSDVRLLSDPRSLTIGIDVKTRATGEVKGNFSSPLRLEKVAATETLTVGDTVTTAGTLVKGFKALLPRDLLIGTIVEVTDDPSEFSKSALIQPAADLDRLEAVLVVTSYEAPRLVDPNATPEPEPVVTPAPDASGSPDKTAKPRKTPKP